MFITESDKVLLDGCIGNERKAQETLYRKYFPIVLNMCKRYTTDDDILLSIINDGFMKIFKNIHKYSAKGSFEGWIKRLVFNSLSDYFKKENKRQKFIALENHDNPKDAQSLSNLYLEDLNTVINKLSKASRDVFILFAIEGYNHKEISQHLGIAIGTSKWHLSKAREELQKLVTKDNLNIHHGS